MVLLGLLLPLAAAVFLLWPGGAPASSALDRPSGTQVALTTAWTASDPAGGPSFQIQLPSPPVDGTVASSPAVDGSISFGSVRLGGSGFSALLLVRFGDGRTSARGSLEKEARSGVLTALGPIRRTRVGSSAALARDFAMPSGRHLREFRFAHDGHLYAMGIVSSPDDTVALDTGLAALQSLRWSS